MSLNLKGHTSGEKSMTHKSVVQVYVGPEDYGCPVRFDHLFTDDTVAQKCVEMLSQLYPSADIHVQDVPVYSEVPRFYLYMASIPFASPSEVIITPVSPTLRGRPFQDVFDRKATHISCANGWGADEAEAAAAAYSLYEISCARGLVTAYRDRVSRQEEREAQIWLRARALGKVSRSPYTREEEVDPCCYSALYDIVTKELSLDR
jgi:hypothetical protein